jgi:putrescine importer
MINPVHKEHAQNSPETPYRFKRTLTLGPLVFMGLAYMSPLALFAPYGVVADLTQGRVAASYLMALVMVLFTAYSYGKMVQAFPSSGSAYTYTQKTMNTHVGFVVGWAVLMDYVFLPMLNSLANGVFLHAIFPAVPEWVWILHLADYHRKYPRNQAERSA